jgi:hypothetical protein
MMAVRRDFGGQPRLLPACNFTIRKMARANDRFRATKKHGRPATGMAPVLPVRAPKELIARIELWAQKQPDKPSRSEAVWRIIELGLNSKATLIVLIDGCRTDHR